MVTLRFTKDYRILLDINEHLDIDIDHVTETVIKLTLNGHWRKILKVEESNNDIHIVTQKFAHSPVAGEELIDLHSIAFSLIYLAQRRADGSATDADATCDSLCEEVQTLHTWSQAKYSPIAMAAEFIESLTESLQDEPALLALQRAWLLPLSYLITIGRPSHMAQGQFLFPFYRALKTPIPFFVTAAYTESAARRALALVRKEKKDQILSTDERIVDLLRTYSAKQPWEESDAESLAQMMSSLLCYLKEYETYSSLSPMPYRPWERRVKDVWRISKHHLTGPGKQTESLSLLKTDCDRSAAQSLKCDKAAHVRLELLPEVTRKRGCPESYDRCAKSIPESVSWAQLEKAMCLKELMISEADIDSALKKAKEAGLWEKEIRMTREERRKFYSSIHLKPPIDVLQRLVLFGNITPDKTAVTAGDDQKENALTLTTNKAIAVENTGSKLLDLFVAGAHSPIETLVKDAWESDPLSALKVLFYHRSITEGKGSSGMFYEGVKYVFESHYRTFLWNLPYLAFELDCPDDDPKQSHPFGYWKDLLEMLRIWTVAKEPEPIPGSVEKSTRPKFAKKARLGEGDNVKNWSVQHTSKRNPEEWKELLSHAYEEGKLLQFHEVVAFLFAIQLKRDLKILKRTAEEEDATKKQTLRLLISLAGKWAPTPNRSHDRTTFVATSIARLLYPEMPIDTKEKLEQLRWRYRAECLRPLRAALGVVERLTTLQQYHDISLHKIPSRALQLYTPPMSCFAPQVVERTLRKKLALNAQHLEPHKLIATVSLVRTHGDHPPRSLTCKNGRPKFQYEPATTGLDLIEAQWKEFVNSMRDIPGMENCVALCDVSGSMQNAWNAIDWAVAFSLLISELSTGPFQGKIITFESEPSFVDDDVNGSLSERVRKIKDAPWGGSTNLEKAMILILELAIVAKFPPEEMQKLTFFIFSDMQFDEAIDSSADAPRIFHEVIQHKYESHGYKLPRIVYWNMTGTPNQPVPGTTPNTVLLSGTGLGVLRSFMCGEAIDETIQEEKSEKKKNREDKTPLDTMRDVLALPCFQKLAILD